MDTSWEEEINGTEWDEREERESWVRVGRERQTEGMTQVDGLADGVPVEGDRPPWDRGFRCVSSRESCVHVSGSSGSYESRAPRRCARTDLLLKMPLGSVWLLSLM